MRLVRAFHAAQQVVRERSTAWAVVKNFAVRVAIIGVTFGTGIVVARTLAPLGRGEQAALSLWPVLLSGLATFGIPTAVVFTSRRRPDDAGRLYFVAALIAVVVGLLVALLGAAAMPRILHGYDLRLVRDAQWLMLFVPQCLLQYVIRAHFESNGEFTRSILGQLVPTMFTLAALVVLRQAGLLTPPTAALCYYVPSCVLTGWLLVRTRSRMVVGWRSLRSDAVALLAYGLRSYGTDVINALSAQLDLAVIVAFLHPVALGLYSVSLTLARLLNIVQQSLVTVLFPHASGLAPERAIALIGRAVRLSTLVSVVLGGALLLIVPLMLPLVYGPAFAAALPIMPILTIEAILTGLSSVLLQAFLCTGRPGVVTLIQAGWLACALALLLVLVPRMQISGAAVALMSAALIRLGLVGIAYRVVLQQDLPWIVPNAADVAYVRAKLRALSTHSDPVAAIAT